MYFPFGAYLSFNEAAVTVPDSVRRIVGFSSVVNGSTAGTNGGGIRFVVNGNSTEPLIIEQFGYGVKVEHHGTRSVVIKDGSFGYLSYPGAGNLFLEDVMTGQINFMQANRYGLGNWTTNIQAQRLRTPGICGCLA